MSFIRITRLQHQLRELHPLLQLHQHRSGSFKVSPDTFPGSETGTPVKVRAIPVQQIHPTKIQVHQRVFLFSVHLRAQQYRWQIAQINTNLNSNTNTNANINANTNTIINRQTIQNTVKINNEINNVIRSTSQSAAPTAITTTTSPSSKGPLVDLETLRLGKSTFPSGGIRPLADVDPFQIIGGHVSINSPNPNVNVIVAQITDSRVQHAVILDLKKTASGIPDR